MASKWRWNASLLAIFCTVLLAGDRPAQALTASQTMAVSLSIANSCAIIVSPLGFGTYVPTGSNATSTVQLTCTSGSAWSVDIDAGLSQFLANGSRRVTNANELGITVPSYVIYNLYKDAGRTQLWGTTSGGTARTGSGTGVAQLETVYATAFGTQGTVPPGNYSDTVNVTVTF